MSEVRESSKAHQTQLLAQATRQKAELERTKRLHEKNMTVTKEAHEEELHGLRETQQMQLAAEVHKKEATLKQMRDSLEKTQRMTELEAQRLQLTSAQNREAVRERLQNDLVTLNEKNNELVTDLNIRQNQTLKEINDESELKKREMQDQGRQAFSNEGEQWRHRINQQRNQFHHTYSSENEKYDKLRYSAKVKHDHTLKTDHRKQQEQLSALNENHVKHQEKVINNHQKSLHDREMFFEKKYQTQLAQHTQSEKHLTGLHDLAVKKSKESMLARVDFNKARESDPFFTFTELKPRVKSLEDKYVIELDVPEYAKEEVLMSANMKELVLTANRRYQDERKDERGVVQKINKVESLVSRIPLDQVVDARKMTKSYAEGVLTFTVKKA